MTASRIWWDSLTQEEQDDLFRLADSGHEGAREAIADVFSPGWDDQQGE